MFCLAHSFLSFQNVPPAILLRFLREHRSEWADNSFDAFTASAVKVGPCSLMGSRVGNFGGQVILPLAHTLEHEEVNVVSNLWQIAHLSSWISPLWNLFQLNDLLYLVSTVFGGH